MKLITAIQLLFVIGINGEFVSKEPATFQKRLQEAVQLLSESPLIDGHNKLPRTIRNVADNLLDYFPFDRNLTDIEPFASSNMYSQTDLARLKEGMVAVQILGISSPCLPDEYNVDTKNFLIDALDQTDSTKRLIDKYSDDLLSKIPNDFSNILEERKIVLLFGVDETHILGNSVGVLRLLSELGAIYTAVTPKCGDQYAVKSDLGRLTYDGKMLLEDLNYFGIIIDLSNTEESIIEDILHETFAPVIFSHSGAKALCNHSRNVPDYILEKLTMNGGLVMVNFDPASLTCSDAATIHDVIDHINHIRNISGVDHVGIGSNFNGIETVPEGLEDVSKFPNLFAELLLDPTWTKEDLKKLAGLNFLRVYYRVKYVKDYLHDPQTVYKMK